MMTNDPTPASALVDLGLNELEAHIYADLLAQPGSTGYRVAKSLGKPTANVYKALASLEAKGAVLVEDGETRRFQPVPADQFLERLEKQFKKQRKAAAKALAGLPAPSKDERIYQIRSADEVLARCRRMFEQAQSLILLDIFPEPLDELAGEIATAANRGVEVMAKVYAPCDLEIAKIVFEPDKDEIRGRFRGTWMAAYVDGKEVLYARMSSDLTEVTYSVYSASPHLGSLMTFGYAFELAYTGLKEKFTEGADLETLRSTFEDNERYFAERMRPLAAEREWFDSSSEAVANTDRTVTRTEEP